MSSVLDATIAKRLDITVKQNQTFNATITFLDSLSQPINLTGADVKMSIRQNADCGCSSCADNTGTFDFTFKQDLVPTIGGVGNNVLQFDDIIKLTVDNYKYDLLVKYGDGTQQYILTGNFKVKKSYTTI